MFSSHASTDPTHNSPLPEVAAALSPYIHTRAETLRIRRLLSAYLNSLVAHSTDDADPADSDAPVTHLTLSAPPTNLAVKRTPKELQAGGDTRVRAAYLSALQSHAAAQARYQAVRDDIDELRQGQVADSASRDVGAGDGSVGEYVALLKLRQRVQRARAVDKAAERVCDARAAEGAQLGIGKRADVREVVEEVIGRQPDMPSVKLEGIGEETGGGKGMAEEMVWKVKRGVVSAKAEMDAAEERKVETRKETEGKDVGVRVQVRALRAARDELVGWIEGELAKLQEESMIEDASPLKKRVGGTKYGNEDGRPPLEQIEERYGRYVTARAELVKTIDAFKSQESSGSTVATLQTILETTGRDQNTESVKLADVLPFLPSLLQTAREERSLVQQNTYLRHQLATTSDETLRTIGRLADESHLVTPGVNTALAWVTAAKEASASTRQFLEVNLEEGERKVSTAEEILGEVHARRENFERLKGIL